MNRGVLAVRSVDRGTVKPRRYSHHDVTRLISGANRINPMRDQGEELIHLLDTGALVRVSCVDPTALFYRPHELRVRCDGLRFKVIVVTYRNGRS